MQQAYQEIPERWYEGYEFTHRLYNLVNLFSGCAYLGIILSGNDKLDYHLIGAGIFIASVVADNISTVRGLDAINRAVNYGVPRQHKETNPDLQDVITSQDFKYNPRVILNDLTNSAISFTVPSLGLSGGLLKITAALSNLRLARRYDRATQIATSNFGLN